MKLLLDTHTFIWASTLDDRLSQVAQEALLNTKNELYFSVASLWEMAIKTSIGKLKLGQPLDKIVRDQLYINDISMLPIQVEHAFNLVGMPYYHRDPFDRMLIAQSLVDNMAILGCDNTMDEYGVVRIW